MAVGYPDPEEQRRRELQETLYLRAKEDLESFRAYVAIAQRYLDAEQVEFARGQLENAKGKVADFASSAKEAEKDHRTKGLREQFAGVEELYNRLLADPRLQGE